MEKKVQRGTLTKSNVNINKLIIIGNGFDLALGMKTSYNDFLIWLIKRHTLIASSSNIVVLPFEKYKGNWDDFRGQYLGERCIGYSTNYLFDVIIRKNYYFDFENINDIKNSNELLEYLSNRGIEVVCNNKGVFDEILNSSKLGWVDIESIYFNKIKEELVKLKSNTKGKLVESNTIDIINYELNEIIEELNNYLMQFNYSISKKVANTYINQFKKPVSSNEIYNLENFNIKIDSYYFLNFNYTETLYNILKDEFDFNYTINHIHGELDSEENKIIFGFGDEMDSAYKDIEELNDNRFFKHIKSFKYFKSPKYKELLTFLNSKEFQVCIYGHSCGLSDRVMLNEIFENENCKSINIFYENEKDFENKTMEISRHFNSNQVMRKKVVDFNKNNKIPQHKIDLKLINI